MQLPGRDHHPEPGNPQEAFMWIAASVPFWLLGAFCLVGVAGGVREYRVGTDDSQTGPAIMILLVAAGACWFIAAKVAS